MRQRPESQIEPGELPQMWFCKCKLFFLIIIINRSQISQRQFLLKQRTVSRRILLNPLAVSEVPLFLWISISREQSEQRSQLLCPWIQSVLLPVLVAKRKCFRFPCSWGGRRYQQIKAEIITEHLWNPDERQRWEQERWGDVGVSVLPIFSTLVWEDREGKKMECWGVYKAISN